MIGHTIFGEWYQEFLRQTTPSVHREKHSPAEGPEPVGHHGNSNHRHVILQQQMLTWRATPL
jgi:hypothetical protein